MEPSDGEPSARSLPTRARGLLPEASPERHELERLLSLHAAPLMALSCLCYLGLQGIHTWSRDFMAKLQGYIEASDQVTAMEMLKPFLPEGQQLSNSDFSKLSKILQAFQEQNVSIDVHGDTGLDAYVLTSARTAAVVFTGTQVHQGKGDVLADACVLKVSVDRGELLPLTALCQPFCCNHIVGVHSGFYDQYTYKGSNKTILEAVKKAVAVKGPDFPVLVSGHSLGAAEATLCGFELAQQVANPVRVINFAAPRLGNRGFRLACERLPNLTVIRVRKDNDPVPMVPALRFMHVGYMVWIRNGVATYANSETREERWASVPYCFKVWHILANLVHVGSHSSEGYFDAVDQLWPFDAAIKLRHQMPRAPDLIASESPLVACSSLNASESEADQSTKAGQCQSPENSVPVPLPGLMLAAAGAGAR